MSNIYIQEPSTNGKVILKTTLGDIDIELWSREAPKACRNFIQLCLEGYYNNTIFHRVIKGFLAQGGDPTGTGYGGDSIYGEGFKDEFHSRLRFVRRGLLAMANAEKNANGSQFFFTLGPCPHLQDKHTIFGKVAGKTLYNMIKFDDLQVDQNEKPLYPPKIISTEVIFNPFDDIVPRKIETKKSNKKEERPQVKGTKDFKLLSFGDEAEEEEEEISEIITKFKGKSKSSHDLLNDPKLSSVPAVEPSIALNSRKLKGDIDDRMEEDASNSDDETKKSSKLNKLKKIKDKFKNSSSGEGKSTDKSIMDPFGEGTSKDFNENEEQNEEDEMNPGSKLDKIKNEFKLLKKQMKERIKKTVTTENPFFSNDQPDAVIEFKKEIDKYKALKNKDKRKRAEKNLSIFEKFQAKISNIEGDSNDAILSDLFKHKLISEESEPVLAKDANIRKEAEWFDIYDPRNPVNKRRREADKESESKSSKKVHHSK